MWIAVDQLGSRVRLLWIEAGCFLHVWPVLAPIFVWLVPLRMRKSSSASYERCSDDPEQESDDARCPMAT